MTQSWDQVQSNPQFQSLSTADQENARQQYFNQVVAPNVDPSDLDSAKSQFDNYSSINKKPSAAEDVRKTIVGNVAPTAAANWGANLLSVPATVGAYAAQLGTKAGEYLAQNAMGISPEESAEQQKDLKNDIRRQFGLKPTNESGDISNYVPTPSNLISGAASSTGVPLYQPKTQEGQATETLGNIATGGIGAGVKAAPAIGGAIGGYAVPQAIKSLGGGEEAQFFGGLAGGLAGAKSGEVASSPEIASVLHSTALDDAHQPIPAKSQVLDPTDVIREHGATIQASNILGANLTQNMKQIAGNDTVPAPNTKDAVSNLRDVISESTAPIENRKKILDSLNHTISQFGDNGEMSVSDAMDLRALANKQYNPADVAYRGEWGAVKDAAQDVLNKYAATNEDFGNMMVLQKFHYENDIGNAYRNNDALQKLISKEDINNVGRSDEYQTSNGTSGTRNLNTDTAKRADSLVDSINDQHDYLAVRQGISDPLVARQFDEAVLKNILPSRAQYMWNAVKNAGNVKFTDALEAAGKTFIPKAGLSPSQLEIYNAIKQENITPTRGLMDQTAQTSDKIMSDWNDKVQQNSSIESDMAPDIAYHQFEHGAGQAQANASAEQAARDAASRLGAKQWRTNAYNSGQQKLLPAPSARPDFVATPEGQVSAIPNSQVGAYQFGQTEGMPFQAGELNDIRARSGKYQNMPVRSQRGMSTFNNSIENPQDSEKLNMIDAQPYRDLNLSSPEGQAAYNKLKGISDGEYSNGGRIPSASDWSIMLHKARKKGYNFTAKDRSDKQKVNTVRKILG